MATAKKKSKAKPDNVSESSPQAETKTVMIFVKQSFSAGGMCYQSRIRYRVNEQDLAGFPAESYVII